jgi:hypothetical protein
LVSVLDSCKHLNPENLIVAIVVEATWFEIHVGNDTKFNGNSIFVTDALKCEIPLKNLKLSVVIVLSVGHLNDHYRISVGMIKKV